MGGNIALEIKEQWVNIGFVAQRESPDIVGVIIEDNKIVFKTRDTSNRGRP